MTMSFELADPNAAADLKAGQHVKFQFTIQSGMSATVTRIAPADLGGYLNRLGSAPSCRFRLDRARDETSRGNFVSRGKRC